MLPNAFIAGAQKSGTTTMCYALERHPRAVVASPKEPAFFSYADNVTAPARYEACFQAKFGMVPRTIIDGSTAYMANPSAPQRIREMLGGDLRFVFCLRAPGARAVSGYWHQAKKGRERRPLTEVLSFRGATLGDALGEEQVRLEEAARDGRIDLTDMAQRFDDPLWNFRYLRNSLYADDLERFAAAFGADRNKVVLFEDLVREPDRVLHSVAAFLGLDPGGFPEHLDVHRNATALPRAPRLANALSKLPGRTLLRRLPGYAPLRDMLFFRAPPQTDDHLVKRLRQLVAPEIGRLEAMLGRDLAAIWGGIDQIGTHEELV